MLNGASSKIIETIKKLLAKADPTRNNNEHEVAAAMAKANELLTEHNLNMDEVLEAGEEIKPEVIQDEYTMEDRRQWKFILFNNIAKYNFVSVVRIHSTKKLAFVGRRENVEITRALFDWLLFNVKMELANARKTALSMLVDPREFETSFCMACIVRLITRLKEQRAKMAAENNKCTALVVSRDKENEDFIRDHIGKIRQITYNKPSHDETAARMGREAGERIPINKELK